MKKVFVFGSLNMDLVITSPREALQGETLRGSGFMMNCGGKGANQAVACGKQGADVSMGGGVGDDDFGVRLKRSLHEAHVKTDRLRVIEGVNSGVAVITVVNGDNRIILDGGANDAVTEADADLLLAEACEGDIFLTQLENRLPVVGYALAAAKRKGMFTVLNPAPMDEGVREYLKYVDVLIPNEHEFSALAGTTCIQIGAARLLGEGVRHIVVTLGSKGYSYCNGERLVYEGCVKARVVDTTAAGDTFCGAFVTRLAFGDPIEQALRFANRAAAITVTRRGAQQSIPTLEEIEAAYRNQ